jgi:hypothetical protein
MVVKSENIPISFLPRNGFRDEVIQVGHRRSAIPTSLYNTARAGRGSIVFVRFLWQACALFSLLAILTGSGPGAGELYDLDGRKGTARPAHALLCLQQSGQQYSSLLLN